MKADDSLSGDGERVPLTIGNPEWSIVVRPEQQVRVRRAAPLPADRSPPETLLAQALEHPIASEPLRRCLTPDDRITLVVDESLPALPTLITGILQHLQTAGISPEAVTILCSDHSSQQRWIDDLPDDLADVRVELHDPGNSQKLAYLATTEAGRRIYLNRTLLEADFVILLTGRHYDTRSGYAGVEMAIFPDLGDDESRKAWQNAYRLEAPSPTIPWPIRKEAGEILWLMGVPYLVQVILGSADSIDHIEGGLLDTAAQGIQQQDRRWRCTVDQEADCVFAVVPGEVSFADLSRAAVNASRIVQEGGRIVVLADHNPPLGAGGELLARYDDPAVAIKALTRDPPADWRAAMEWASVARSTRLFLGGGPISAHAENLFAVGITENAEAQRLATAAERLVILPDAHRTLIEVQPLPDGVQEPTP